MISKDDAFDSNQPIDSFSKTEAVGFNNFRTHIGQHALPHRPINQGVLLAVHSLFTMEIYLEDKV